MSAAFANLRRRGPILVERQEVDETLASMGLSRELLERAAYEGNIDRLSAPRFGFDGHAEYNAGSRIVSSICENGGMTDGGWHRGTHLGIPVALNYYETIAIHPTGGTIGTGVAEGQPFNRSPKGPETRRASSSAQIVLELDDQTPVDFFWFFTCWDGETLWAELFAPIFDRPGGIAAGWSQRVLLGRVGNDPRPESRIVQGPIAPPDIEIQHRSA